MLASNPESIAQVLGACKPHLGSESLPFEPRLPLVEGLARLVGQVRLVDVARQALKQLIAVPCERLHALVQQLPPSPPSAAQAELIAQQMALITSSIKYCDKFSDKLGHSSHPVPAVMGQLLILVHEAAHRCGAPAVIQALCDFYSKAMLTLRTLLVSYMPQLLVELRDSFLRVPMAGCLQVVTQALELYGAEQHDLEVKQVLIDTLEGIVEAVCGWLSQPGLAEAEPGKSYTSPTQVSHFSCFPHMSHAQFPYISLTCSFCSTRHGILRHVPPRPRLPPRTAARAAVRAAALRSRGRMRHPPGVPAHARGAHIPVSLHVGDGRTRTL